MGDGRYYTYYQFISIIILTFLAMFTVANLVISYYRNKDNSGGRYITFTFLGITLIVIARFFESVLPSVIMANILRYFVCMIFIIVNITFYFYVFVFMFPLYEFVDKDKIKEQYRIFIISILFLISGLGVNTKGKFLIDKYSFLNVEYSLHYVIILSILLGFILISAIKIFTSKKHMNNLYCNQTVSLLITVLFSLPMAIYIIVLIRKSVFIDFIEFYEYFILCIAVNMINYSSEKFGLTTMAFNKIGDMIRDYVFVIDTNNNIVYKNRAFSNANFFVKSENIDISRIKDVFNGFIKAEVNDLGKEYIQLTKGDKKHYFTYEHKVLKDHGEAIGYIITIIDITELMDLVYYLKERKEKAEEANKKLINNSKVIYHLEKEKKINKLLEEIITSREKEMENLVSKINSLKTKINDNNFEIYIDEAIKYNADILEGVRHAVTAYREHYGG